MTLLTRLRVSRWSVCRCVDCALVELNGARVCCEEYGEKELNGAFEDNIGDPGCCEHGAVLAACNEAGVDGPLSQAAWSEASMPHSDRDPVSQGFRKPEEQVTYALEALAWWESVFNQVDFGVVVLDLKRGRIAAVNETACSVLQARGVEVTCEGLRGMMSGEKSANVEQLMDGKSRKAITGGGVIGYTLYRGNQNMAVMLIRDITELCQLEAVAQAANLTENIGYVFAGIRHELGNPVNSMKVALQVLRRNLNHFSAEQVGAYLERISDEVARVEHLLAGLRSFSMYETPQPRTLHLPVFMNDFMVLVRRDLDIHGVRMTMQIDEDAEYVMADSRALSQVLLNVITNAMDACEAEAEPRIALRVEAGGGFVRMQIDDNGVGIHGSDDDLFKPFRTTKKGGTGLGLVITRKLLAAMHGTIAIRNLEGGGARVTIVLLRSSDDQSACCEQGGDGPA